jgi:hypothetical protein
MMRKMDVKETVRMVFRTLMLMNVQKRRLQKRKRQHEGHQVGDARQHTLIVPFKKRNSNFWSPKGNGPLPLLCQLRRQKRP